MPIHLLWGVKQLLLSHLLHIIPTPSSNQEIIPYLLAVNFMGWDLGMFTITHDMVQYTTIGRRKYDVNIHWVSIILQK